MSVFRFKQFSVTQVDSAMKVGTDAMLLGSLVQSDDPINILDVGCGTGVIALMLAQQFPNAKVTGIELDALSAAEAKANFEASPWKDRMEVVHSDFLEYHSDKEFDLIVSNPPYYESRLENKDGRKAQARHEFSMPKDETIKKARDLITEDGSFWVIVPSENSKRWYENAVFRSWKVNAFIYIKGKERGENIRTIFEFGKKENIKKRSFLAVRKSDDSYTDEYIELTKEFHYNDLRK